MNLITNQDALFFQFALLQVIFSPCCFLSFSPLVKMHFVYSSTILPLLHKHFMLTIISKSLKPNIYFCSFFYNFKYLAHCSYYPKSFWEMPYKSISFEKEFFSVHIYAFVGTANNTFNFIIIPLH